MKSMSFEIRSQWHDQPIDHEPVKLFLKSNSESNSLDIEVEAPFFDDPAPNGKPGQPFPQLWDYEVVEAFFLGEDDKYLEVELCPHGQHLVLLLNGRRNMLKDQLSLEYSSHIDKEKKKWTGKARIPFSYFPVDVTKFNAYAIHGSGEMRIYEALYPADASKHDAPDFHRLEYFRKIDMSGYIPDKKTQPELWINA
eukprot:gene7401-8220_t